jgi:hypothetical protein
MIAASQANAVPAACRIGLVEDQCRSGMRTATIRPIKAMTSIMVRATAKGLPSGGDGYQDRADQGGAQRGAQAGDGQSRSCSRSPGH